MLQKRPSRKCPRLQVRYIISDKSVATTVCSRDLSSKEDRHIVDIAGMSVSSRYLVLATALSYPSPSPCQGLTAGDRRSGRDMTCDGGTEYVEHRKVVGREPN